MIKCPNCGRQDRQVKAGTAGGVQRYKCMPCGRRYSLDTRPHEYPAALREQAMDLYANGTPIRQIARELSISPQTASNWIRANPPSTKPAAPSPASAEKPFRQRVTITDVARHAGVSTATISNYLNDKGRMSHETRLRIGEAMRALYFTPNALVRAIRHRRTHTLGLMSYGIYHLDERVEYSVVAPVIAAINRAADAADYNVLLYTGWPHRPRSRTGSDFLNGQIDGLLWMSPRPYLSQLRIAAAGGLPVMSVMSRRVSEGVGYVVADNVGGIRDVVMYLAGKGHRRIAYLGSTAISDFIDRTEGYREGLAAAGIAYDPEIVSTEMPLPYVDSFAISALDRWLAIRHRPTAIVTAEDRIAELAIETIRGRGLKVPADVVVVGFNDLPSAETRCGGLTSVHQPFDQIGQIAVEKLVAMIEGAPVSECRITVPVSLVLRSSTELTLSP